MTAPADTEAGVTPPAAPKQSRESLLRRGAWLLPTLIAGALTVVIMGVLPADRTIDNLGEWAFRISPVVFAVIAASLFPRRPGLNLVLLVVLVFGYMGVIDTWMNLRVLDFADAADQHAAFPSLYQMMVFIDALFIIAVCFAYRLGGAKTGKVLRLGFAGIIVLVSGLNDLAFYYVYQWPDGRPARLDWASHIAVFIGGTPTPTSAIVFCAVNLLVAAAVVVVPWYIHRRRTTAAADAAVSAAR